MQSNLQVNTHGYVPNSEDLLVALCEQRQWKLKIYYLTPRVVIETARFRAVFANCDTALIWANRVNWW